MYLIPSHVHEIVDSKHNYKTKAYISWLQIIVDEVDNIFTLVSTFGSTTESTIQCPNVMYEGWANMNYNF